MADSVKGMPNFSAARAARGSRRRRAACPRGPRARWPPASSRLAHHHGHCGAAVLHVHGDALAQLDGLEVALVGAVGGLRPGAGIRVVVEHARDALFGQDAEVFDAGDDRHGAGFCGACGAVSRSFSSGLARRKFRCQGRAVRVQPGAEGLGCGTRAVDHEAVVPLGLDRERKKAERGPAKLLLGEAEGASGPRPGRRVRRRARGRGLPRRGRWWAHGPAGQPLATTAPRLAARCAVAAGPAGQPAWRASGRPATRARPAGVRAGPAAALAPG